MLSTYDTDGSAAGAGVALLFALVFSTAYIGLIAAVYVVSSWFLSKIFVKAGEPAWKAWVPVYNSWVFLELGGFAGWWVFVSLLPLVGIAASVVMCIAAYNIGLRFAKTGTWVVLFIFLPLVWWGILGFNRSVWSPHPRAGIVVAPEWAKPTSPVLRYIPQAPVR
ncbi:DUF5684 domain-containing protein [Agreia sp. COWG]|uniref:DUF5684 domain-containing protein n=1 Tax=Agreia sp. COWG TaxID=2773266 RepID=UPI0019264BF0|nr:DUF5684 domain-containing protein [Agreia sp. COWG]CAD6000342.1 conserved membrane protein of unknown function [Agreia sp. COWG]